MTNNVLKTVQLANGKNAVEWTQREKPSVNHWYLSKDSEDDYWKIKKDFYSSETKETYYRIIEYYNGDILYCGRSLSQIREIMRDNTYRMVI